MNELEPVYETRVRAEFRDVDLKKNVRWLNVNIPITASKFMLRRAIKDFMKLAAEEGLIQMTHYNHTIPSYTNCRIPVFTPSKDGNRVRVIVDMVKL